MESQNGPTICNISNYETKIWKTLPSWQQENLGTERTKPIALSTPQQIISKNPRRALLFNANRAVSILAQLFFVPISWDRSEPDQIDHHKHHISTDTSTRRKSQTQISPQTSPQTSPQSFCQHMFLTKTTLHKHTLNCSSWRPYKYSSCPKRFYYKINQASLMTNISLWHLLHFTKYNDSQQTTIV